MDIDVGGGDQPVIDNVETVEVVASGEDVTIPVSSTATVGLMDQHMITSPEGILVPTSEVQIESQGLPSQVLDSETSSFSMPGMGVVTIPVEPSSPTAQGIMLGTKRSHPDSIPVTSSLKVTDGLQTLSGFNQEIPRKKSRNYLDSHKTIEKKRRDRINQCLESLKSLVPDCRQYGSKKLDKAEILEMCIEYIQKIQRQGGAVHGGGAGLELNLNQREWANDLTTWVINNKVLYSGASALDQFCQALLLHLQGMGSGNALASATSMLLSQANASSEEDALLRQQTVNAQVAILQQLQQQLGALGGKEAGVEGGQLQQAQLTQLQALLLLQQHQQLQQQQQQAQQQAQQQDVEAQSHQQLQQLQQLQALLLQHITSESSANNTVPKGEEPNSGQTNQVTSSVTSTTVAGEQLPARTTSSLTATPGVELTRTEDLEPAVTTEETVYTSGISEGLDDENLIQVNVSVSQTPSSAITNPASSGQMWSSSAGTRQSLLMLGGGSESEGEGPAPGGGKSQLVETTIIGTQEEEVELLTHQEQ